jgi:hypothetical protein
VGNNRISMLDSAALDAAIRARCTTADVHLRCSWPECGCKTQRKPMETAILAYLAARRDRGAIEVPIADYKRLLEATESDDMIVRCEVCGAWLDRDDPATATLDDFTGCWKAASHRAKDSDLCRSYRALD